MGEQLCDRRLTGSESCFLGCRGGEMQGAMVCTLFFLRVETCNRLVKGKNMETELCNGLYLSNLNAN